MRVVSRSALAAALAVLIWVLPTTAWADEADITVAEPAIANPTGLARDADNQLYWLVQPGSPDGTTTVFGIAPDGTVASRLMFRAETLHAAAVAMYAGLVMVADIADPDLNRETVEVYGAPVTGLVGDKEALYSTWHFRYPDGPHDAAAFLVHPDGHFVIVTSGENAGIYESPVEPEPETTVDLLRIADAPTEAVTDGLYLSTDLIALRADDKVIMVDAHTYRVTNTGPIDAPGGSLALTFEGTNLIAAVTAGDTTTLYEVAVPQRATLGSIGDAGSQGIAIAEASRSGTIVMLGAALILALIAGIMAFLRR